jgi:LicD family
MEVWGWVMFMFVVVAVLSLVRALIFAWDFPTRESWSTYLDEEHRELYRMMEVIHKLLGSYGIPYWITGGSLLGAAREKRIFKWDDDIDLCVLVPHEKVQKEIFFERWNSAMMDLKKDEMKADPYAPARLVYINQIESTRFKKHRVVIDVNLCERAMQDDRVVIQSKSFLFRKAAPNEFFFLDELEPLALYPFGDSLMVWGPAKAGPFLARSYPGAHLTGRVQVPHTFSWFPTGTPWCQLIGFFINDYPLTNEEKERMAEFLLLESDKKISPVANISIVSDKTADSTASTKLGLLDTGGDSTVSQANVVCQTDTIQPQSEIIQGEA